MRRLRSGRTVLVSLALYVLGGRSVGAQGTGADRARELRSATRTVEEYWTRPRGGTMLAPEHDFPQRVGYRRNGADSLSVWIEGTSNWKTRRIPFQYARSACPSR